LFNGQYIEVVCPLDHPATDATLFGQAVKKKAEAGGGWLTWVFSTEDISAIEDKFSRKSIEANRILPNGLELKWRQIGVSEIVNSNELPFFIQWLTPNHPSESNNHCASIQKITISSSRKTLNSVYKDEIYSGMGGIEIEFVSVEEDYSEGIFSIDFKTKKGVVQVN
jgi:hypothetical protein